MAYEIDSFNMGLLQDVQYQRWAIGLDHGKIELKISPARTRASSSFYLG